MLTKIGLRFYLVNELKNLAFYVFTVLCSYIINGKKITEIVKNLQEFLVKDYDLTSHINQHGTNADKRLLMRSKPHAVNELTYINVLKFYYLENDID